MTVAIETLPWASLTLQQDEILWPELERIADAAVESADARDELLRRAELELSRQVAADQYDASDLTDLAAAAVLGMAADRLDHGAKMQAADYLLRMLKRSAESGEDYLEEAAERCAGRLGTDLIEPLLALIESEKCGLHCWFSAFGLLCVAEEADAATQQQVARFCRRYIRECPDRFEAFSLAVGPGWVIASLRDRDSLPLLKTLYEESHDREIAQIIRSLEGHEPEWARVPHPWHVPIREWLPALVSSMREAAADEARLAATVGLEAAPTALDPEDEANYLSDWQRLLPGQEGADNGEEATLRRPILREAPKVGRNDACPCGSGKKYKKCCGR